MTARVMLEQNKDTTGWSVVGLILGLVSSNDLLIQAIIVILFPTIGWLVHYFVKREVIHRFPPKKSKQLPDKSKEVIQ